jgi:hypothetical protein
VTEKRHRSPRVRRQFDLTPVRLTAPSRARRHQPLHRCRCQVGQEARSHDLALKLGFRIVMRSRGQEDSNPRFTTIDIRKRKGSDRMG